MLHIHNDTNRSAARRSGPMAAGLFTALLFLPFTASCGVDQSLVDASDEEEEHAAGAPVELSAEQMEAAGIELFVAGPGRVETRLSLPAIVEPDMDATSHVTPKISGVVRSVHAGLGQRIERGDLLAVIDSVELGVVVADYRRALALAEVAQDNLDAETVLFAKRLAALEVNFSGQIAVRQTILEREQELRAKEVSTVRPLLEAERELREAELARGMAVAELESERDTRVLELRAEVKETSIEETSAMGHLAALGLKGTAVQELLASEGVYPGSYSIRAEAGGVVTARDLSVGKYVETGDELFEIQDLARVWVMASVFEDDLRQVHNGQAATVRLHAFPGEVFHGEVKLLETTLDTKSRSLALRIELDNGEVECWSEELPFRPGMFGDVSLVVESREVDLAVPEAALVHEAGYDVVYVEVGEHKFAHRVVETLGGDSELLAVRAVESGGQRLRPGDKVAVGGGLVLKSLDHAEALLGHDH